MYYTQCLTKDFRLSAQLSGRAQTIGPCHERRRREIPARGGPGKFEIYVLSGGMYMFSLVYLGFPAICLSSTHLWLHIAGKLTAARSAGRTTGDLQTRKGWPHAFQVGFCDGQPLKSITDTRTNSLLS